ncbi:MAG: AsmA family protein [Candidatus Omnitrophota bacterium]|nr:AsmA family protein [Candidatus Omnitrophota bacterium]
MKLLNIKGIAILAALLIVFQIAFALIISPILGSAIIDSINEHADAKVTVEKVTIWPLTLSCSLKGLKVFDPDNEKQRMVLIRKASIRVSPLGLLSKRLVLARVSISGAEIDLKGEPDGTFNVQKLARSQKAEQKAAPRRWTVTGFRPKKDWFGRIWNMIKSTSSKEAIEKERVEQKESERIERDVQELPKGRRVFFKKVGEEHLFQIRDFVIKDSRLDIETKTAKGVSVEGVKIIIKGLGLDPVKGARFNRLDIKGRVNKDGAHAGTFNFQYSKSYKRNTQKAACDLTADNVDLTAVGFIYEDSLPVDFTAGRISIKSRTAFLNDAIDSKNVLTLREQNLVPKDRRLTVGIIPLPAVCEALNQIDPVTLRFQITGTVDKPQFKGFQDTLMAIIKPYLTNIAENIKKQGVKAIGDLFKGQTGGTSKDSPSSTEEGTNALDSIKSLFGGAQDEPRE